MVVEHRIVMTSSQGRLLKLLKGLQAEASRWPGYRLGSTWQELDQPATFVSMSHWSDARGIFKKCVSSQAVYPLSEQHGLEAQERR